MVSTRQYNAIMASTRGKRRADSALGEEEENDDVYRALDDQEANVLLEEAESNRLRKNKKKRTEAFQRNHPPFEAFLSLPELLVHILSYLDDPKDVYNLCKIVKVVREVVTPEVVVRSAVFAGGKTREATQNVMELVQRQAIRPPSVFRLLRLVNAKQCERLEDCHGYNLETEKPQPMTKSGLRPFGLAICQVCAKSLSVSVIPNSGTSAFHKVDFLATYGWTGVLSQAKAEASTGEHTGPLLLCQTIKQIQLTYKGDQKHELQLAALKNAHAKAMEDFNSEYSETLVHCYLQAQSEYEAFVKAKDKLARDKAQAKEAARASRKKEKVVELLQQLKDELAEHQHSDLIFAGEFSNYGYFECSMGPSQVILGDFLSAPSSATKKKVKETAQELRELYDLMHSKGFLSSGQDYLHCVSKTQEPTVLAIYRFCKKNRNCKALFGRKGCRLRYDSEAYHSFVKSLKEGNLPEALFMAMCRDDQIEAIADYYTRKEKDADLRSKLKILATRVLQKASDSVPGRHSDVVYRVAQLVFGTFRQKCAGEYLVLSRNLKEYLNQPDTRIFLSANGQGRGLSRQQAIDTVLELDPLQEELLRIRDYEELLDWHIECFETGRRLPYHLYYQDNGW